MGNVHPFFIAMLNYRKVVYPNIHMNIYVNWVPQ